MKVHEKELEQFAKQLNQKGIGHIGVHTTDVGLTLDILFGKVFSETITCHFEFLKVIFRKLYKLQIPQQKWVSKMDKEETIQAVCNVNIHTQARKRKNRNNENCV